MTEDPGVRAIREEGAVIGTRPIDQGAAGGRERRVPGIHENPDRCPETKHILGAAILGTGGDAVIHSILDIM